MAGELKEAKEATKSEAKVEDEKAKSKAEDEKANVIARVFFERKRCYREGWRPGIGQEIYTEGRGLKETVWFELPPKLRHILGCPAFLKKIFANKKTTPLSDHIL